MLEHITTIRQFYDLMGDTASVRRPVVEALLGCEGPAPEQIAALRAAAEALRPLAASTQGAALRQGERILAVGPGYETSELEKDLLFLEQGEEALLEHLAGLHPAFQEELDRGIEFLEGGVRVLLTDRDGTVNNYCGRYLSSVQSAYNAVFLARFAAVTREPVILTSAPLSGLLSMSTLPPDRYILAGSKGREYRDRQGFSGRLAVDPGRQRVLDRFNRALGDLVSREPYLTFPLIGSGLQLKHGQTTVARQDIHGSIPPEDSRAFLEAVTALVEGLDPRGEVLRIEDTGKDIEIVLTVEGAPGELKDFDKGDGARFLDRELSLRLADGSVLVCGDTASDLPMARAALEAGPDARVVFVTGDETLKSMVRRDCPQHLFVSSPDVLVALLGRVGRMAGGT